MRRITACLVMLAFLSVGCSSSRPPIVLGAIYPLTGSQGSGGIEEFHGVRLAVDMINRSGGLGGRRVQLQPLDVADQDAVPGAIDKLHRDGTQLVIGSYGSTISAPAAKLAMKKDMLFWETGAVGDMNDDGRWLVSPPQVVEPHRGAFFRVAPTGSSLGRAAISFMATKYSHALHRPGNKFRYAVANVDDIYGRSVASGAMQEIRKRHLPFAGRFQYDPLHPHFHKLVKALRAARPDILFVSAYIKDGVGLRRAIVRNHLHLAGNIGSSSSYCMPAFGAALGNKAVGVFASDKPDAEYIAPKGLLRPARHLLRRADRAYRARYHAEMSAAALAGFSGAWALLNYVLPRATSYSPAAIAAAARSLDLPKGSLPNGGGLKFGTAPGTTSENVHASSVIWEWVGVDKRAVVWPRRFATQRLRILSPNR
ncbi:MAG: ABC transporter substrate-binding protein [Actinomycetota bacterium]|nr:ABC transporter substrate-binding protein [Actinomycetota bacterium]